MSRTASGNPRTALRVHRNLHAARAGGPQWVSTVRGKVAAYLPSVALENVTTRVQPGGVAACQRSGVRSVVAFFDGHETDPVHVWNLDSPAWQRVQFDPRHDSAFRAGDRIFNRASVACLCADGSTYVLNPTWEI
jgi:hypothetical protein